MASRLENEAAVRALVLQERYFKDTAQWDRWRQCYHPEAVQTQVETVWISGTIDDFVAGSRKMSGAIFSRHLIQPVDARVVHDRALVISYGHVLLRARLGDDGFEYDCYAWGWWYHRARLVSEDDGPGAPEWKVTWMRFVYDRDSIEAVEPAGNQHLAKIQLPADARLSYKYLEWMLTQLSYPVSKALAGTDKPETVQRVREEEEAWLVGAV